MTPGDVVTALLRAGVRLSVAFQEDGERLELIPAEAVTAELVEMVRKHKAALVEWFCATSAPEPPVVDDWPPEGSLTHEDWGCHHEACFRRSQAAMVERTNRRAVKRQGHLHPSLVTASVSDQPGD